LKLSIGSRVTIGVACPVALPHASRTSLDCRRFDVVSQRRPSTRTSAHRCVVSAVACPTGVGAWSSRTAGETSEPATFYRCEDRRHQRGKTRSSHCIVQSNSLFEKLGINGRGKADQDYNQRPWHHSEPQSAVPAVVPTLPWNHCIRTLSYQASNWFPKGGDDDASDR